MAWLIVNSDDPVPDATRGTGGTGRPSARTVRRKGVRKRDPAGMFAAIWEHYSRSRFLYAAKLERLQPAWGLLQAGWPHLLTAPTEVFQFHAAVREELGKEQIVSSICAYRDTSETYVVQHAASEARTGQAMLACICSCLAHINADPEFQFAKMYFRPQNRWPARASSAIARALPSGLSAIHTSDYLYCDPAQATASMFSDAGEPRQYALPVADLEPDDYPAAVALAQEAAGPLRAASLGFALPAGAQGLHHTESIPDLMLRALNRLYLSVGLRRSRRILAVHADGALAGLALCYSTTYPMNLSFLCGRTELLLHPDAPDRGQLVRVLARASIAEAAARGEPVAALLADSGDVLEAKAAGYVATHKQYACFTWMREGAEGAPSAIAGVRSLYGAARQRD